MKFAAIFLVMAFAILAQPPDQHGVRTGQVQIAYLVKPVEVTFPAALLSPHQEDSRAASRQLMEFLNTARENAGGVPVSYKLDGRPQVLEPNTAVPCVEFENWAEQLLSDYSESVYTGFSDIQWEPRRTTIQRFVQDNLRHAYVSYALTIEPLPESGSYQASFAASNSPIPGDVRASTGWKVVSPANFPAPQIVQSGDTIALDLYTDTSKNQKLVDYIHVGKKGQMALRKEDSRDSYASDAEFNLVQPHLKHNGLPQESAALAQPLHGPVLWIDVPGEGRYVLAFQPGTNLGLEKVGEVAGNSITFMVRGNVFRIESEDRIAAGSGTYRVYGRLDPNPNGPARITFGSAAVIEPATRP